MLCIICILVYSMGQHAQVDVITPLWGPLYGSGADPTLIYNSALWFLPALFIGILLLYGVIHFTKESYIQGFILCGILAIVGDILFKTCKLPYGVPWGIDKASIATVFLYAGYQCKQKQIISKIDKLPRGITLGSGLIGLIIMVICSNNNGMANIQQVNNLLYYVIGAIGGIIAIILFAVVWGKSSLEKAWIERIGKASLIIMIFQSIGMGFYPRGIINRFKLDLFLWEPNLWYLRVIITISFCLGIDYMIRKSRILSRIYYSIGNNKEQKNERNDKITSSKAMD